MVVMIAAVLLLGYTWLGYPALLWLVRKMFKRSFLRAKCRPTVSVIVAVFNEEAHIAAKLEDCVALDYPPECLEILVASDGSTDATEQIVQQFAALDSRIRLIRSETRAGKTGVQNLAVQHAAGEILLFTDAETRTKPNLLEQISESFADPRVGMVAPAVYFGSFEGAVAKGQ